MLKETHENSPAARYEFDRYEVDTSQRRLERDGRPVPLFPKALDTLILLLERQGETLSKDFMLRSLWPGVVVQENSLARAISDVRKALDDDDANRRYIITVPRRGYMFAADIAVRAQYDVAGRARAAQRSTADPEAYRELALGRLFESKRTSESMQRAIQHFERALGADESCAEACAGLARAYNALSVHSASTGGLSPHETRPKARAAALKALAFPDPPVEAYVALASVKFFYEWDFAEAESMYQRALQIDADCAETHHSYAIALSTLGRHEEAWREIMRARALDPVSLIINANVGFVLYLAGRYRDALEELRGAILLDPHFPVARHRLGLAYEALGMPEEAEAEFAAMAPSEADQLGWSSLAYLYAMWGRTVQARELLERLLRVAQVRYVPPSFIAQAYVGLGEDDAAFAHLERAFAERAPMLVGIGLNRRWARLRSNPRFEALVRRVGSVAGVWKTSI
jgi:DNA-binding winged helix-turn-helix (wHTH) protein/Flp pilus assembly protein TadD